MGAQYPSQRLDSSSKVQGVHRYALVCSTDTEVQRAATALPSPNVPLTHCGDTCYMPTRLRNFTFFTTKITLSAPLVQMGMSIMSMDSHKPDKPGDKQLTVRIHRGGCNPRCAAVQCIVYSSVSPSADHWNFFLSLPSSFFFWGYVSPNESCVASLAATFGTRAFPSAARPG